MKLRLCLRTLCILSPSHPPPPKPRPSKPGFFIAWEMGVCIIPVLAHALPARIMSAPLLPRVYRPTYEPLGFYLQGREPRYVIRIGDDVGHYRAGEMASLNWLLGTVYPDPSHWTRLFPGTRSSRCDSKAAASWFIRGCRAKGVYTPPT